MIPSTPSIHSITALLFLLCTLTQTLSFCPTRQPFLTIQSIPSSPPQTCSKDRPLSHVVLLKESQSAATELEQDRLQDEDDDEDDEESKIYKTNLELAKLASRCARRGRQSRILAMSAYEMLQNMTHPDTVAYNSVLKAFAKSSPTKLPNNVVRNDGTTGPWVTAAERAQSLLEEMILVHDRQASASQDWYVRNAQGQLAEQELTRGPPRVRVKPNVRSFSTVMDAWSRTGNPAATRQVLQTLEDRYQASGQDVALQPNIFSYNTVLSAYSKSKGGAAEAAEEFLETMPVRPDVISYNALLHAWARSGSRTAGDHAEAILRQMPVEPNARSYTTVMDAWSRSKHNGEGPSPAERAHSLLDELKYLYDQSGDLKLKPNCVSYSTVIHAYALSKEPQKAQRAYELLQEMNELGQDDPHVLPNTVTYNSVLNACATSSLVALDKNTGDGDKDVCLQNIVQSLYAQLTQSSDETNNKRRLAPDHFTFGTVLKACANNIFWDDPTFGMYVFEEACRRGQVSVGVLVQLRQAVPMHIFQDFLPPKAYDGRTRQFSMSHIPDSWKRNVRERGGGGGNNNKR